MNDTLERLEAFRLAWRGALETYAQVVFETGARDDAGGTPVAIADRFVSRCGYTPIGFHWEMLDITADVAAPRSARGAFEDALSKDLVMRSDWLGTHRALACAEAFIGAFKQPQVTLLTNHIVRDGGRSEGWNPISDATLEWAFVGYDGSAIALLLLTAED